MTGDAEENFLKFAPIGYFRSGARYRHEAPRQPGFSGMPGVIELLPHCNYETALSDLSGFDRIWVIFVFHLNSGWKPKASPPLSPAGAKYGVFATRAPYRPNPVGLSCLELEKIEGCRLYVRSSDLLSGTPVLDIKPYIAEIDAFPDARSGWRDELDAAVYAVEFTPEALCRMEWLREATGLDLENFCRVQLRCEPLNRRRKRLSLGCGEQALHCRTWRISFTVDEAGKRVTVKGVLSNYGEDELVPGAPDPYGDKDVHRAFRCSIT